MPVRSDTLPQPVPLGLKKSFGYGDRLGLATPGHLAAHQRGDFAPIFAQQSIRELDRTRRTAEEVMLAARHALAGTGFDQPWGADADHLKTQEDVDVTAAAGYRFFTIDPSEYVVNAADTMGEEALSTAIDEMIRDDVLSPAWESRYLGKSFQTDGGGDLRFEKECLHRAAVKYSRAIHHAETMATWIADSNREREYEIEVSVDETDSPTSAIEHLFFALELQRRRVPVVSLAPRFIGRFEKGVDYKGDLDAFEASLKEHVAIARAYGPYKLSVHSGSDKFSIYPIIGRVCGDLLHVKTAGTSYLEALRVICRQHPRLFAEIVHFAVSRFSEDRATYFLSATEDDFKSLPKLEGPEAEDFFLDQDPGRQLLHVTFGSVLTRGIRPGGQTFKEALLANLERDDALHQELLEKHLGKHIELLSAG